MVLSIGPLTLLHLLDILGAAGIQFSMSKTPDRQKWQKSSKL